MNMIECDGLTKKFNGRHVLDSVDFSIRKDTITGLVGRNGAGKSTMLKLIAGFIRPTAGEVRVFGERPFNSLRVSANAILIDEKMTFPPALTLSEVLNEAARFYENWDSELAEGLFSYFGLQPGAYHGALSKGMKSTFNMIVGLASRCRLTMFDEPTSGMDAAVRKDFNRALLKDYIAYPRTILLSSHHLEEVDSLLEDILLIHGGKVKLHEPMSQLKEWATGLEGRKSAIEKRIEDREIIHIQETTPGRMYVVVRGLFSDAELRELEQANIQRRPVSAADLCVYLTNNNKGGIDDVFNRHEQL